MMIIFLRNSVKTTNIFDEKNKNSVDIRIFRAHLYSTRQQTFVTASTIQQNKKLSGELRGWIIDTQIIPSSLNHIINNRKEFLYLDTLKSE